MIWPPDNAQGPLERLTGEVLVQHLEEPRQAAIYTYRCPTHFEGYRTMTALLLDRGEIVTHYGLRLSA